MGCGDKVIWKIDRTYVGDWMLIALLVMYGDGSVDNDTAYLRNQR